MTPSLRTPVAIISGTLLSALLSATAMAGPGTVHVDPALVTRLESDVLAREYHLTALPGGGFSAPNRTQRVRATWDAGSLRLAPRTGQEWTFSLELAGMGRGEIEAAGPVVGTQATEGRLEWTREGIVEWYVNDSAGVEQGFTIDSAAGGGGSLVLEMRVSGLTPELQDEGTRVGLRSADGEERLGLQGLAVVDADGTSLPALFEVAGDRVRYVIEDADAVYPIVVDPYVVAPAWVGESNQNAANYGWDVAAGDVNGDGRADVAIGAPFYESGTPIFTNEGQVFVYLGGGDSVVPDPGTPVGVHFHFEANQAGAGAGSTVAFVPDINGDGTDELLVGAYGWDDPSGSQPNEGAMWLFTGSPGTGLLHGTHADIAVGGNPSNADWYAEGDNAGAELSTGLATGDYNGDGSGDILVGAPGFTYFPGTSPGGAAFLWVSSGGKFAGGVKGHPGNNIAIGNETWKAGHAQSGAHFGYSVALGNLNGLVDSMNDILVGARQYETTVATQDEGAVYEFISNGLVASDTAASADASFEGDQYLAYFGHSLAIGDVNADGNGDALVGAIRWAMPVNSSTPEGAAFLFLGPHSPGIHSAMSASWRVEGDVNNSQTGYDVDMVDSNCDLHDDLVVGAPQWNFGGLANRGRVALFDGATLFSLGNPRGMTAPSPTQVLDGPSSGAKYGYAVEASGDVDGDGQPDLVVGAPFRAASTEGAAYIQLAVVGDADGDTVSDCVDQCPGADDKLDSDADGSPDCLDCAPLNPAAFPGGVEVCDGADNDCDGQVDEGFDADGDGYTTCGGDCNDNNPGINPGASEIPCNGIDENCNGAADDTPNADGDPVGLCAGDCDDNNPARYPGNPEVLCNSIDDDCNPATPDNAGAEVTCNGLDDDCNPATPDDPNVDGDPVSSCSGDCDDNDPARYPGNAELCNGIDDNCNLVVDEGFPDTDSDGVADCVDNCDFTPNPGQQNADADAFGDACDNDTCAQAIVIPSAPYDNTQSTIGMGAEPAPFRSCGGDGPGDQDVWYSYTATGNVTVTVTTAGSNFDTALAAWRPPCATRTEIICNDDVSFPVDPTSIISFPLCTGQTVLIEAGGFGGAAGTLQLHLTIAPLVDGDGDGVLACTDCNDANPNIYPGAPELCDGLDNDCNGVIPANEADGDGDGYRICQGDCNDGNPAVNPGAAEISCNGIDDDCNPATPDVPGAAEITCNGIDDDCNPATPDDPNADGDPVSLCSGDCDDNDPARYPGNAELCNGIEDNCNLVVDEGFPDTDSDGVADCVDNCDFTPNPGQQNADADAFGDACDNDTCAQAIVIPSAPYDNTQSTVGMGAEPAPFRSCGGDGATDQDVWYSYTATGNVTVTVTTAGSNFNTALAAWRPPCAARTEITCHDDVSFPADTTSVISFPLCTGQTVLIEAGGFNGAAGTLQLHLTTAPLVDGDGDGVLACTDCNDANATVYPGAPELCDGLDNDCNGVIPANEADGDGDGYRICQGDCNDGNPAVNPGAAEISCNGIDDDCNPATPDVPGPEIRCNGIDDDCNPATLDNPDVDGDGDPYCTDCNDNDPASNHNDADGDGFNTCDPPIDCNDANPAVNPGAAEISCNFIDDDCNAATPDAPSPVEIPCNGVDDDCNPATLDNPDADGDGDPYCTDCDDNDPASNHNDADGDGFNTCDPPIDCDDNDPNRYPADGADADSVDQCIDNCLTVANPDQANFDGDARGDACDNCTCAVNDSQNDCDADGIGDACDGSDTDGDGTPAGLEEDGFACIVSERGSAQCSDGISNDGDGLIDCADPDCDPVCP